jgi:hypothetical protein
MTKLCRKCNTEKLEEEFNKCKASKDGLQGKCRTCETRYRKERQLHIKDRNKKQRERDKEDIKKRNDVWRINNKEKVAEMNKEWREKNPEKERIQKQEYYKNNKESVDSYRKQWRKDNSEYMREWNRNYAREQRANNPQYVIRHRLTNRIKEFLNGDFKSKSTEQILGCSYQEFYNYIESKFTENMTWRLFLEGKIHLDHIRPCCSFDLTKQEELEICFHFSNYQPLWETENKQKLSMDLRMRKEKAYNF